MPIRDCPFTDCGNISRPILPINIINPHKGNNYRTFGIIDTGADECAIPASVAPILEHDLQSGQTKKNKYWKWANNCLCSYNNI